MPDSTPLKDLITPAGYKKLKAEPELLQAAIADTSWLGAGGEPAKAPPASPPAAKEEPKAKESSPELKKMISSLRQDLKEIRDLLS